MIKDIIIILFILLSGFFFFVGTTGLIRLPDVFSRMHATTKSDTLGAGLMILSLIIYRGIDFVSLKLFIILIFILITNPVSSHIIAKSAYYYEKQQAEDHGHADI